MKIPSNHASRRGMTYFTVVISAILIGAVLATYLKLVASQNQNTMRSLTWNRSIAVMEAGVEEALAHLNKNASYDSAGVFTLNLARDNWQVNPGGGWIKTNTLGDDYYVVTISDFNLPDKSADIRADGYVKQQPTFAALRKWAPFLAQAVPVTGNGYVRRAVACNTTNVPVFTKALVAKETIDLSGQHVRSDSFDSSTDLYSTSNRYDIAKFRDNGDIAANRVVTNSLSPININNANIFGHVSTGPNSVNPGVAVIYVGSQGMVGSKPYQADLSHAGTIQPGWSRDDMNVEFPEVQLPYSGTGGPEFNNPLTGRKHEIDGVEYDMYFRSGDFQLAPNATLSGNIYVERDVRIIVPNTARINMSGSDRLTIGPNGSVKLYVDCATASLGGSGVQNPGIATNFYYFGTANNTSLSYGGNSAFTGVFYAPSAAMTMNGSGNSQNDFCGSAIARTIKMTGNFNFHYDENLKRVGLYRGFILTSWNEM